MAQTVDPITMEPIGQQDDIGVPLRTGAPASFAAAARVPGVLAAKRVLFWQGELETRDATVREGVVRAVRLLPGGERQILHFFWPGDVIAATPPDGHCFTAETVTRTRLVWTEGLPESSAAGLSRMLQDVVGLLSILSHRSAPARLAWFLLRIRPHLPACAGASDVQRSIIPRADMADHLGMAPETVCRLLSEFQDEGLIALPTRKSIRFTNLNGLSQVARS